MSVDLAFVFENAFPNTFKNDKKYNELKFAVENIDIKQYPVNLRKIWYKFIPSLLNQYPKLRKVYDETKLMNDIEQDELLAFIPMYLIDEEELKTRAFHKLLEEDYHFQQLTERNDRKHFNFNYLVRYDLPNFKGWNINEYLKEGKLKLNDLKKCVKAFEVIDTYFIIDFMNKYKMNYGWKRFTNKEYSTILMNETDKQRIDREMYATIIALIVQNFNDHDSSLEDLELLQYSPISYLTKFNLKDENIKNIIIKRVIDEYKVNEKKVMNYKGVLRDLLNSFINNFTYDEKTLIDEFGVLPWAHLLDKPFLNDIMTRFVNKFYYNEENIKTFYQEPWINILANNSNLILDLLKRNESLTDFLLKEHPYVCPVWFQNQIKSRKINKGNFDEYWNKYGSIIGDKWIPTYCGEWIVSQHDEPPLKLYIKPNENCGSYNVNCARLWERYVNAHTTPKEMTSLSYYEYMIKTNGKKRNPNHTTLYTFFSNTDENKIIFCRSDVELMAPARPRYSISVDYSILKPFLHEELDTNNICSFTHLTKDDWNKVTGGRDDFDIVCFSEMKNIYRERTPLKNVLEHFVTAISLQFDVEPEEIKQ